MKKNILLRLAAVLLTALLLTGLLPAGVFADEERSLEYDSEIGYFLDMSATGDDTLDLSDKSAGFSFTVYDNGGADENYSDGCNSRLIITAPDDMIFQISGSGVTESKTWDYLIFNEGNSPAVVGEPKYGGAFSIAGLATTGNELAISFHSDDSINKSGFALNVTVADASSIANVTFFCGDENESASLYTGTEYVLPDVTSLFVLPYIATFIGWECDGTLYNEGDTVTVNEDMTFTAVIEYGEVLVSDGEGGYYALVPASGTIPLDLTDKSPGFSFTLYDDGGPDGDYSNNCDGYFVITAPKGTVLSVSGGGVSESISYDWLTFYDGDTDTVLGSAKYGGSDFTVDELITSGSVLIIYFRTDGSQNYSGFALTVTVLNADNLAAITFVYGEETRTVTVENGDTYILPEFTDLFTLPEEMLFDGWNDGESVFQPGSEYIVTGDVTFTAELSDEPDLISDGHGGWYTRFWKTTDRDIDLSDKPAGFTFKVYDNGGPDGRYSDYCSSYLTFTAPGGTVFTVSGFGKGESVSYDWLTFYDGDTGTVLGGDKYGGTEYTIETMATTGNVLIIYFQSDNSNNYDGFELTVTLVDPDSIATIAFSYGEETETMVMEKGDTYIFPDFSEFFTQPDRQLFSGWNDGESVFQPGSGYTVTADVTFTAEFTDEPDLISDGHGGWYTRFWKTTDRSIDLSNKPAGFTFKVYDNGGPNSNYSDYCSSYLTITARAGTTLSVSGFGKGETTSCDWLTFYDGDTDTVLGGDKYGGSEYTIDTLTTSGNVLIIYFKSDYTWNYEGFELTVEIVGDALFGDVNGDGSVTISDVTALLDVLSGQDEPDIAICDLSGDGDVTIADVTTLLDMLSGSVS